MRPASATAKGVPFSTRTTMGESISFIAITMVSASRLCCWVSRTHLLVVGFMPAEAGVCGPLCSRAMRTVSGSRYPRGVPSVSVTMTTAGRFPFSLGPRPGISLRGASMGMMRTGCSRVVMSTFSSWVRSLEVLRVWVAAVHRYADRTTATAMFQSDPHGLAVHMP